MRLFTAIDIPEDLRQALGPLFQESIPGLRWTPVENLHLTLRFIGEVPNFPPLKKGGWGDLKADAKNSSSLHANNLRQIPPAPLFQRGVSFEDLKRILNELRFPSFSLQPQGLGVFPTAMRPRILWLGLQGGPELFALQNGVEKALQAIGLKAETKAFVPHLTLGRCKFPAPREIGAFLAKHRDFAAASFEVREFHLYSSDLSPRGSIYRRESSYSLL